MHCPVFLLARFLRCDRGAFSTMWAILLPVLIGSMGLAVDTGNWYTELRKLQSSSDAAAISAAHAISPSATQSELQAVAVHELQRNGFSSSDGTSVTVNFPPTSGSYSGNSNAVEVIVTKPQNRIFSMLALAGDPNARARSVGVSQNSGNACILALESVALGALDLSGSVELTMTGCTLASNSTATSSINISGNVDVTAYQLYSAGGIRKQGSYSVTTEEGDITNASAIADPYASFAPPSYSGCDQNNYAISSSFGTVNLSPGVFCNGLRATGTGTINLAAGTYIIDRGNFDIGAGVTVNGTGVTIILTSSTGSNYAGFDVNGSAVLNMSAPTSGTNAGMLLYKDRNATGGSTTLNGNASTSLEGVLYMPSDSVTINGNFSSSASCTQLVSRTLAISGDVSFTTDCSGTGMTPITIGDSVRLAE